LMFLLVVLALNVITVDVVVDDDTRVAVEWLESWTVVFQAMAMFWN
jgi:hypothetical protein